MSMTLGFGEVFARICEELKGRITRKVRASGVTVAAGDIAQLQNVIVWMTIDPELQERLLMTALEPAD
jgi:hypothetical protein